ncbi:MAG TPA: PAS domain S-box protein [Tepidisphaeraceae bacterium]|nr:PAS domain S-box protein [Tepidisphaeraceae bacterium]
MSPITAAGLAAAGSSLLLSDIRRLALFSQILALITLALGLLASTGYLYQVPSLYRMRADVGVAIHTAISMFVLAIAILFSRPTMGLMIGFSSNTATGVMARRMLPAAIVIPLLIGWLQLMGQREGYYGAEFGVSLLVLTNIAIFAMLIGWNTSILHRLDQRSSETANALRASESYKAAILDTAVDAIITIDTKGTIESFNPAAQKMFGYAPTEVIGRNVRILMPQPYRDEHDRYIAQYLETGIEKIIGIGREVIGLRKDGSQFPMDLAVSEVSLGHGVAFAGIVRDITERKRSEESLVRQAEELTRSNIELERFAYVASHDLQEPVRTVMSFSQLLEKRLGNTLEPQSKEFLDFITDGVIRMHHLINDLLAYSRVNSQGAAFISTNCTELVSKILKNLQASIESQHAQIEVEPLPTILADSTQLGQLFQNLLANALKFHGPQPPEIRIGVKEIADGWLFHIKDNGIGIAKEYHDRIFVIFQRLHTIEEYGGTGIGLAICKKIVERHGGRIWVDSSVGSGSTFYFSIPRRERQK